MDLSTLAAFRRELYACFRRRADALMNIIDALTEEVAAQSFAELSLSPFFVRKWGSLYKAIKHGDVDRSALRKVLAKYMPHPQANQRLVLVIDASNIPRPESVTARDRTYIHLPNLSECRSAVSSGWVYSTVIAAPSQASSWGYVLDNQRVLSSETQGFVGAEQLRAIVALLRERPVVTGDRYYGCAVFLLQMVGVACDILVRIKRNRRLYREVHPRGAPKRGRPRIDGPVFRCNDPSTHQKPDHTWVGNDDNGRQLKVDSWDALHFKESREVSVTLIRVTRSGATGSKRDPRVSWFVWAGKTEPVLTETWSTYKLRFSIEHSYRMDKQKLLWCAPHFRTPEAFELWTIIVGAARDQLVLARPYVTGERRLWDRKHGPATPEQVRRSMGKLLQQLGTPARPSKTRGLGAPGRQKGAVVKPATRYPVIKKGHEGANRRDSSLMRAPPGSPMLSVAQPC